MKRFDDELAALTGRLIDMGRTAQTMITAAMKALVDRDAAPIATVFESEQKMNAFDIEIDDEAIRLLAVYTPVAADLRLILMISRINSELERIGDHVVNMAERIEALIAEPPLKPLIDLPRMSDMAAGMVAGALEAFAERDVQKAREIRNSDDRVDHLNDQIFRELLTYVAGSPENTTRAVALILLARSIERIADHATNICEEVVYLVEGEDIRHHA